jgi:predicted DNA-binding transcriptional regulator AlpA
MGDGQLTGKTAEAAGGYLDYIAAGALAEQLGVSLRSLERWRETGTGPRFTRLGRRVVYLRCEVDKWVTANTRSSTSESRS